MFIIRVARCVSSPHKHAGKNAMCRGYKPIEEDGTLAPIRRPRRMSRPLIICNPVAPWGRFAPMRKDIVAASTPKSEGGTGVGAEFWAWTEEQVKPYL